MILITGLRIMKFLRSMNLSFTNPITKAKLSTICRPIELGQPAWC
ncbi:UNVERIFIED_CONTAM: hypothetical protein GTU68_015823 [Idotea baltica]|nr:hypothetical protein [Idotea baltica]